MMELKGLNQVTIKRAELVKLRLRALRRGLWFRVLSRVERALMELSVKVVERVHSLILVRSLTSVVKKLLDAMENNAVRGMRMIGGQLAQELSRIAQSWGNESAVKWAADLGFARFLAVNHMNMSCAFEVSAG